MYGFLCGKFLREGGTFALLARGMKEPHALMAVGMLRRAYLETRRGVGKCPAFTIARGGAFLISPSLSAPDPQAGGWAFFDCVVSTECRVFWTSSQSYLPKSEKSRRLPPAWAEVAAI
jgi:hypothetical protein